MTGRTTKGRFAPGNAGGPGRPPRATEATYLATLRDAVSVDDWSAIVGRAVSDAKQGDRIAREWLSRHLLGPTTVSLTALAALDLRESSPDELVILEAARQETTKFEDLETLGGLMLTAKGLAG